MNPDAQFFPVSLTQKRLINVISFLDATPHLCKRSCPSVCPSVRPSVPSYFRTPNMAIFEGEKSSTDVVNSNTMSDDEEVASDVPPRYLLNCPRLSLGPCQILLSSEHGK